MKPRKIFAVLALALSFAACGPKNLPKAGQMNFTITTVIADAGTIANQAEQQYQAAQIPQNEYNRKLINDLGTAYNDAKNIYRAFLMAYAEYGTAQQKQIQACTPAGATGVVQATDLCQSATAAATTAKTSLINWQTNLNTTITALTTKTNAVKAVTKK